MSLPSLAVCVRAVCWLPTYSICTLMLLYIYIWHRTMANCKVEVVRVAYLRDAKLVGNPTKLHLDTVVTDLEYADDMALVVELT